MTGSADVFDELRAAFAVGDTARAAELLDELRWRLQLLQAADRLEGARPL